MTGGHPERDEILEKRRTAYVAYQSARGQPVKDTSHFDTAFYVGWSDGTDASCHDNDDKLEQRKRDHKPKCGSDVDNALITYTAGYKAGFDECRRSPAKQTPVQQKPAHQQQPPAQPQQPQQQFSANHDRPCSPEGEDQLKNYRQRHIDWHRAHNTGNIEVHRYDDGFRRGWTDAEDSSCSGWQQKYEERKGAHIQRCGDGQFVWEFEHGYKEAFEAKRNQNPKSTPQCESVLAKQRTAHIQYHTSRGTHNLEVHRYDDGFRHGWKDAHEVCGDHNQKQGQRKEEHVRNYGSSGLVWEYEHGYQEGFKAEKEGGSGGGGGSDGKYEEQLRKHRDGHQQYHQSRNTRIDINIFIAGFKYGWDDKKNNCANDGKRKSHQDEYARSYHGDKNLLWEFEHGYNEGCKAKSSC